MIQDEVKTLKLLGVIWPSHLVDAHAKHLTGKWFRWRLTRLDRDRATLDLLDRYEIR